MKKLTKFFTTLLAVILLFSFVACNKENATVEPKTFSEDRIIEDSSVNLLTEGFCGYVIVYPKDTDTMITSAVKELKLFFKEATGVDLLSYTDFDYVSAEMTEDYISIGNTSMFNALNISTDYSILGTSGYYIKLVGKNLYIAGGYHGNLFGVYEFLANQFNFEVFAEDEIAIDKVSGTVKMKNFNIKDIPSVDLRVGGNGEIAGYAGGEFMYRMRMMSFSDVYVGGWGDQIPPFHNTMEYITPGEYIGEHPDWFSPDGSQLCLTRDPDGLLNALIPKMIEQLDMYPTRNIISFTQMDGPTWCTCESCKFKGESEETTSALELNATAEKEYYSAQNIRFMCRLAKMLDEEYTVENGYENGRHVNVYLFSYGMTSACPVKYDNSGKAVLDSEGNYQVFDDALDIPENLGVIFCYGFNTTYTGEYNQVTQEVWDKVKRWQTVSKHFSFWAYSTHFTDYFAPYDSVQQLQDNVRFAVNSGAQVYYNMAQYDMKTPVDFGRLESYLQAKLSWDCNANVSKLIEKFFNHYYKDAASVMKKLFNDYKVHMAYLATERNIGIAINTATSVVNTNNWSYKFLNDMLSTIDEAYKAIEYYKRIDTETYNKLYGRINLESFTFKYLLYKLYPDKFDYDELLELQNKLITECRALGVSYCKEGGDIGGLF